MSVNKAIEDYTGLKDDEIKTTATSAIAGLTGNANFTFVTQLTDVEAAETDYSAKLALVKTGGNS